MARGAHQLRLQGGATWSGQQGALQDGQVGLRGTGASDRECSVRTPVQVLCPCMGRPVAPGVYCRSGGALLLWEGTTPKLIPLPFHLPQGGLRTEGHLAWSD